MLENRGTADFVRTNFFSGTFLYLLNLSVFQSGENYPTEPFSDDNFLAGKNKNLKERWVKFYLRCIRILRVKDPTFLL